MATVFDVVNAVQNAGVTNPTIQNLAEFLILNEDDLYEGWFEEWVRYANLIREIIKPVVAELFPGKSSASLTEDEQYVLWDAIPYDMRRSINVLHLEAGRNTYTMFGVEPDERGKPCFYYGFRDPYGEPLPLKITYVTEYGNAPETVENISGDRFTAEYLPTLTAEDAPEGYVHTGWVGYYGYSVNVGDYIPFPTLLYAVWEKVRTYTVEYFTDHGIAPPTVTVQADATGEYLIDAGMLPKLSADGYIFKGWSLTRNGAIIEPPHFNSGDAVLYAVWGIAPTKPSELKHAFWAGFAAGVPN